jgi:hypothetical protein
MKEKLTGDETDGAENGVMFKLFKVQSSMFRAQTPAEADALRPDYVYSIQRGPLHDTMLTCCTWSGRGSRSQNQTRTQRGMQSTYSVRLSAS